jgi:hypothetical protein
MTGTGGPPSAQSLAEETALDSTATDQLAARVARDSAAGPDEGPPFPEGPNGDRRPPGWAET